MLMNLCYEHRLHAQLEGISNNLKTSLAHSTDSPRKYIGSSLVQDFSEDYPVHLLAADQCLTLRQNHGAWLRVGPLAPGGLICDDLLIQSDSNSFSRLKNSISDSGITVQSACTMTAEQFHSRFKPNLRRQSLQSDKATQRVLVMMPDVTDSNQDNLLVEKIGSLLKTFNTAPGQTSIECLYTDTFGATKSRELLTLLQSQIPVFCRLGMTAVNPDRQNMLAALMGNASLVLCGHSGHLADAFQFGLPAVLWNRTGTLTTDSINHYSIGWFRRGCRGSKSMIARQQQDFWLRVHTGNNSAIAITNIGSHLSCVIEKWLLCGNDPGTTPKVYLEGPPVSQLRTAGPSHGLNLVIPSAFSPIAVPSRMEQLKASLERKHRKLVKFRHSPTRFIEDSEARWLRAFKHLRS